MVLANGIAGNFGNPLEEFVLIVVLAVTAIPDQAAVYILFGVFCGGCQQHRRRNRQAGIAGAVTNPPMRCNVRVLPENVPNGILTVDNLLQCRIDHGIGVPGGKLEGVVRKVPGSLMCISIEIGTGLLIAKIIKGGNPGVTGGIDAKVLKRTTAVLPS